MYPQPLFLAKIRKSSIFYLKFFIFYCREKSLYIAWTCYLNVTCTRRKTQIGKLYMKVRYRGYIAFFMLNSTLNEVETAQKYQSSQAQNNVHNTVVKTSDSSC